MTLKVAVLQTGRSPDGLRAAHGDYDEMCKAVVGRSPAAAQTYAVMDGALPESVDAYDAFIITGSRYGVYEEHDWIAPLEALIREAFARQKKIIGICFGHQILAQALGAHVQKSDKGLGFGLMQYKLDLPEGESREVSLYAWHQDQVMTVPDGAEVIASSDFCPIAGLRYGDQAISLQPHPEFSSAYIKDLILSRRGSAVTADAADVALQTLDNPVDNALIEDLLADFLSPSS